MGKRYFYQKKTKKKCVRYTVKPHSRTRCKGVSSSGRVLPKIRPPVPAPNVTLRRSSRIRKMKERKEQKMG